MRLQFLEFVLDTSKRVLLRGDVEVPLEPKVFDCIALLAREGGELVTTQRLRSALWPGVHVADGALRRIINEARKALGDTGSSQRLIRTRKKLGYVFVPEVVDESHSAQESGAWPFVGRTRELRVLSEWVARENAGGLCFLSGEAGAGKSRLLSRLGSQSAAHGRWLFGHCQATFGLPALWPFREISRQVTQDPLLRSHALALAARTPGVPELVPELRSNGYPDDRPIAASVEKRFDVFEAMAALLQSLSCVGSLALVIEDVHWADDGSLALLEAVARAARNAPLHLFATYRPEAVAPGSTLGRFIGRISGRSGAFSLHLEPLGVEDLCALLAEVALPGSPARAAPALLRRTGGNALYVHELVRHLVSTGAPLEGALPPNLQHIIAERIRWLPEPAQQRLAQAAVLEDDFEVELLRMIAGTSRATLDAELEPARQNGLLGPSPLYPEHLRFSHALVRDALSERLRPDEKQAYHAATLRALREMPAGNASAARLAAHAFEAGDHLPSEERRALCERAGREAFAALAFDRAAVHLARALGLLPADESLLHAAELAVLLARARWHADEPEADVEEAFLEAAALARRAGSPMLLAEAALGHAVGDESSLTLRIASMRPEALDLVEEAWQRLVSETVDNVETLPGQVAYRLAAARCWLQADAGQLTHGQRAAERALALAPEDLSPIQQLWLLGLRVVAEPARALVFADEVVERTREPGLEPHRCIEILAVMMAAYLARGELARYERAANEVARLRALLPEPTQGDRLGERMSIYMSLPLCVPVMLSVVRGELADAERRFWEVAEQVRRLGFAQSRESENDGFHILLQLYGYLGRSSQLEPLVNQRSTTHPEGRWFHTLLKAQFALERGDRAQAETQFAWLRSSGLQPMVGERPVPAKAETLLRLADVCVEVGTPADAASLYGALLPRADYFIHDGTLICWGSCARPLGALAFHLGRYDDAERHYADALAMNRRIGHRPETVRTGLGLAQLLLATGRVRESRELTSVLQGEAVEMGMEWIATRAKALLER